METTTTTKTTKQNDKLTVRGAVKQAFDEMGDTFFSLDLCIRVRQLLKKQTMDGTILRRFRSLRSDGLLDYRVIDIPTGEYKKVA